MSASINKTQLGEAQLMLKGIRLNGPKIIARTLNKTAKKGVTLSSKHIIKQVRLKSAYVKEKLKVKPATWTNLQASISAQSRGLLLMNYATGVRGDQIKVRVKKGRAKTVQGGFLATIFAGKKKVDVIARRHPKTGKFDVLYGPSVSQLFNSVKEDIDEELAEFLIQEAERQVSAHLRGY